MRTVTLNTGFLLSDFNNLIANWRYNGAAFFDAFTLRLTNPPFAGYHLFLTTAQFNWMAPACDGSGLTQYIANDIGVSGALLKCSSGESTPGDPSVSIEVDEQTLTLTPNLNPSVPSSIDGIPFLEAVAIGALDAAVIQRDRWFFARPGSPPVGGIKMFYGFTSSIDKLGRTQVSMKVKSDLVLLNEQMPRNVYQPNCQWTIYDSNCGVTEASFQTSGAVGSSSTASLINWSGATAFMTGGKLFMESGPNTNVVRTIKSSQAGTSLQLAYPLPFVPVVGDLFKVSDGCDRQYGGGCAHFSNQARYRGFQWTPIPELAV